MYVCVFLVLRNKIMDFEFINKKIVKFLKYIYIYIAGHFNYLKVDLRDIFLFKTVNVFH